MKLFNYFFIFLYYLIRPLLGPACCRFDESCGAFAIRQLKEESFFIAITAIVKRLCSCAPWGTQAN